MAKHKEEKTNALRILDQKKIPYTVHIYDASDGAVDGVTVARTLGQDEGRVYKTLVTRGASGQHYVFDIPVAETLDLKKAAKAVGEKSVAMILSRELLPLTGYVHGGCSPVGMKNPLRVRGFLLYHRNTQTKTTNIPLSCFNPLPSIYIKYEITTR